MQDIEEDQRNLINKSLNNKNIKNIVLDYISQDGLLVSKLSSSLKEIWFCEQDFLAGTPISDIKYNHPGL